MFPETIYSSPPEWGATMYASRSGMESAMQSLRECADDYMDISLDNCVEWALDRVAGDRARYISDADPMDAICVRGPEDAIRGFAVTHFANLRVDLQSPGPDATAIDADFDPIDGFDPPAEETP